MTQAEKQFRAKYPNTRLVVEKVGVGTLGMRYTVYAGDYLCAESWNKQRAFAQALELEEAGFIQPDPNEVSTAA